MKKVIGVILLALCMFMIPLASGWGQTNGGESSPFFWSQGRKVYLDQVPDQYLALYDEATEKSSLSSQSLGVFTYRVVEPPTGIRLPGFASLMKREAGGSKEQSGVQRPGQRLRALIPVYREKDSGTMVLPTDTVLVKFSESVSRERALEIMAAAGLEQPVESPYRALQFAARCPGGADPLTIANSLYGQPGVEFAHPDLILEKKQHYVPNDPLYSDQWHLNNTGQEGATPGVDIQVEDAWDIIRGAVTTTVAVVDSGIMWNHEDLVGNFVAGINFENGGSDPSPDQGSDDNHGTACAGIAVGKGNNGKGISGVCPQCGFVAVRYGSSAGDDADMFYWQDSNGVKVSSNSWSYSGGVLPDVVYNAITYVTTQGRGGRGMIVAVAAGNDYGSISPYSMAAHPNVIAVGASTSDDLRAAYSNFGSQLALMAPSSGGAVSIVTTDVYPPLGDGYNSGGDPGDYYDGAYTDTFSGTSAATPTVAGVAGLMLAANPWLTRAELTRDLLYTCDRIGYQTYVNGRNNLYGYGRVNAYKAVTAALATTHTGWWYDKDQSGTGISIEVQGLTLFLAWYAYDYAGRPVWITSDGSMQDNVTYKGSLYAWNGWPLGSAYYTPYPSYVGEIQINFLANNQAQIQYSGIYAFSSFSGGAVYNKFMDDIVGGTKDLRDLQGWWYDPSYNGMGVFMEARGGTVFMAWYNYRGDTTGRWWSTGGNFASTQTLYSDSLDEFLNGQCFGCAWKEPALNFSPGNVTVNFLSDTMAQMNYNGTLYSLVRFPFGTMR